MVKLLLGNPNTDINAKRDCMTYHAYNGPSEKHGETPLYIACQNKNKEIVDLLLSCENLDITIGDKDKNTPLHIVCQNGDLGIAQKLLSYNKECINKQNSDKKSALYFSYLHKHDNITAFLLEQDAIDLTGILSLACERNDMKMINKLLNHKNIKFDDNHHLYIACKKAYSDIVALLLQHNKNDCMHINKLVYDKDLYQSYNPLLIACKQIEKTNPDRSKFVTIIKSLLTDPCIDINIKTDREFTVFLFAAADEGILRLLLAKDSRYIAIIISKR
jgi:ankyrin repeat protein